MWIALILVCVLLIIASLLWMFLKTAEEIVDEQHPPSKRP